MSSPSKETEEPSSSGIGVDNGTSGDNGETAASEEAPRPPAKRRLSATVIEISDTESDDSDICAVTSYQASADEVKRIRGAEYSSSSSCSSSSYSSDSESPWEDDSIVINEQRATSRPVQTPTSTSPHPRPQLFPRANRMEDPKLNHNFKSQELIDRLSAAWKDCKDMKSDEVTLTCDPFRVCLLHNLLSNPDIINNIVDDMNTLDWSRKKMDLYEFHQTADLASLTWQRSIRGIYELLKTEVMSWVSSVTGLSLSSVSASCSLYGPGDHLLVHDDLLADRRVAFILYLAPWPPPPPALSPQPHNDTDTHNGRHDDILNESSGWREEMGGALELLAHDENGPTIVTKKILPANNMLAFFKVTPQSFHQVSEVVSMEIPRLSINGWFHGPAPEGEPPPPVETYTPPEVIKPHNDVVLLSSWISASYMSPRARLQVQQHMERHSEAALLQLLQPERCEALLAELARAEWRRAGPPHRRRYCVLPAAEASGAAAELLRLASSAAFCRLLAECTDLTLVGLHSLELQRWAPRDFSLLPARAQYGAARLEARYCVGAPATLAGAATVYVAAEGDGADHAEHADAALLTVPARHNALSLVYCDPGAASFTKYYSTINVKPTDYFYVLACTYTE